MPIRRSFPVRRTEKAVVAPRSYAMKLTKTVPCTALFALALAGTGCASTRPASALAIAPADEARVCAEVPDADRDQGPFARRDRIVSVSEVREKVYPKAPPQLVGAAVYVRATPRGHRAMAGARDRMPPRAPRFHWRHGLGPELSAFRECACLGVLYADCIPRRHHVTRYRRGTVGLGQGGQARRRMRLPRHPRPLGAARSHKQSIKNAARGLAVHWIRANAS